MVIRKLLVCLSAGVLVFGLTGCGEEQEAAPSRENIWSEQTEMINKSKEVEQTLRSAADAQREAMDESP